MIRTIGTLALISIAGCASVRTVDEGVMYRSGQLSPAQMEAAIDQYNIRTVLNLRGFEPDQPWYQQQWEVCRQHNVRQVDLKLDPAAPNPQEVARLLETLRSSPKPMLMHSRFSSGQVGWTAAVYRLAIRGESKDAARQELAIWQSRHIPIDRLRRPDEFLEDWTDEEYYLSLNGSAPPSREQHARNEVLQHNPSASEPPPVQLGMPTSLGWK